MLEVGLQKSIKILPEQRNLRLGLVKNILSQLPVTAYLQSMRWLTNDKTSKLDVEIHWNRNYHNYHYHHRPRQFLWDPLWGKGRENLSSNT